MFELASRVSSSHLRLYSAQPQIELERPRCARLSHSILVALALCVPSFSCSNQLKTPYYPNFREGRRLAAPERSNPASARYRARFSPRLLALREASSLSFLYAACVCSARSLPSAAARLTHTRLVHLSHTRVSLSHTQQGSLRSQLVAPTCV